MQCKATAKSTGKRCARSAIAGGTVVRCGMCGQYTDAYTTPGPRGRPILILICPRCDRRHK